jgi:type I restriction enzyme S subunit
VRLKNVASVRVSNVDKKSFEGEIPVRLCNYTDVYYSDRIRDDRAFMTATASSDQVSTFVLRPGQTLITKDSETADDIGVPAFVDAAAPDLVCGYHLAQITPQVGSVVPSYLFWALASRRSREQLSINASGVTRFGLRTDAITNLEIPMPQVERQRRIADFLDAETSRIDALIAAKRQMIERLVEARVDVTRAGVVGELTSQEPRVTSRLAWAETLPETWKEAKLTLLAMLGSGHTPSRSHPEWWVDCTIPWITTGEVAQMRSDHIEYILETREKISALGMANSSAVLHPAGTVVLCRTAASAGYSAIMATDMAVSQDIVTWTCGERLRPRYLLLCLRAMRRDLLDRLATGSTHKTIYMPDIESIRIPVPPLSEQDAIVDEVWRRLSAIDELADNLTGQVELLRERRQALITTAVSGELGVT